MNAGCAAGLRCPVCGGALALHENTLRCAKNHSFDCAREGYVNLLTVQRRHAADPGDGKGMVQARRRFLAAGYYAPFAKALAELCAAEQAAMGHSDGSRAMHIVDAGCGEGSYDAAIFARLEHGGSAPALIGFDLSREAVRLAARLVPQAGFCVGGSFAAPVADGWADVLVDVFSPLAVEEFARMLHPGGAFLYAVPTARHLFGLKQVLYEKPYENAEQQTEYPGFVLEGEQNVSATVTVPGSILPDLFAMTPYYWKTPADGAERLTALPELKTEIGFRFLRYRRQ